MRGKSVQNDRKQNILDAAAKLLMHHGYDKMTMGDVAEAVGVSRGIVYLHFENKEALFGALIQREMVNYVRKWIEFIEADPRGGTVGGIYRAVSRAINSQPLMATMMKRDRRVFGSYLRSPDNLFASMSPDSINIKFLQALQAVGAIRNDIDPALMSHIMDILSYGLLTVGDFRRSDELPPYEIVMESIAEMLDAKFTPDVVSDPEAAKAIIRDLAAATLTSFAQTNQQIEK